MTSPVLDEFLNAAASLESLKRNTFTYSSKRAKMIQGRFERARKAALDAGYSEAELAAHTKEAE